LKKFQKVEMPREEILKSAEALVERWKRGDIQIPVSNENAARAYLQELSLRDSRNFYECYINNLYQVAVYDRENPEVDMVHLSIKRRDRETMHDWRDLQEIKNMLVGPENEAVEIYPAESRRVDAANQYHLWVFKDTKFRLPFGFNSRFVTSEAIQGGLQRPL
jgi:hypothetical protein